MTIGSAGEVEEEVNSYETRLHALGLDLPGVEAQGSYVPALALGQTVWISGQLPLRDGQLVAQGNVGSEVSVEQAREAARICAANVIAAFRSLCGGLHVLHRVLRVSGFVAAPTSFRDHAGVVNAASEVFTQVFGERGKHTRIAIGVSSLPLGAPVEIEAVIATHTTASP